MSRSLPDRPSLEQLKTQAKELLAALRSGDPEALSLHRRYELSAHTPSLHQAQLILAREYGFPSWPRLKAEVESRSARGQLEQAIKNGDLPQVQQLVRAHPSLLNVPLRSRNWGPPLVYAAQVGQLEIVRWLYGQGPADLQHALSRAAMWAHREVMGFLVDHGADPNGLYAAGAQEYGPPLAAVCEVQNPRGMAALLDLGARFTWRTSAGEQNPVAMLLGTYNRNPEGKHACLEVCAEHGFPLPDTPVMALHRGRIDLLDAHLRRDPGLLRRHFAEAEIYPPSLGIAPGDGLHIAAVDGGTLLHLAVEFCEPEVTRWLLDHGSDPNARAAVNTDGFGGHTPLFHTVVTLGPKDDTLARLLLDRGADPNIRATLRKQLRHMGDPELERPREFRDVTPLGFAARFHWPSAVNHAAVALAREHGGPE